MRVIDQVRLPALGVALLASSTAQLFAQSPQLIADINTTRPSRYASSPQNYAPVLVGTKQHWVFRAYSQTLGTEIWITDGTTPNTKVLKDINPGTASSAPVYMTPFKGEVYFRAYDGRTGYELWKTNGTTAGTVLVKDLYPGGRVSGTRYYPNGAAPGDLRALQGKLYFGANVPSTVGGAGRELSRVMGPGRTRRSSKT